MINLYDVTKEDIDLMYKIYIDVNYPHYFRHFPEDMGLDAFMATLVMNGPLVAIKEENVTKGFVQTMIHEKEKIGDLSMLVLNEYQHQGIALKAAKLIAYILFNQRDFKRIACYTSSLDDRAQALLELGHFKRECSLRKTSVYQWKNKKQVADDIRFVLTKENYKHKYLNKGDN